MKKKIYIKPQSIVIASLGDDGIMHNVSYDIEGEGGGHGTSQDGTPGDDWWKDEKYDENTTTPTSIFDY